MSEDLVHRLKKRAEIRRQITDRKSVQEGKPDRIADLLEEAARALETREWVDMTDEQMQQAMDDANASFRAWNRGIRGQQFVPQDDPMWHFWKAIQNKLKELNT